VANKKSKGDIFKEMKIGLMRKLNLTGVID
jgi:hypothetical protein